MLTSCLLLIGARHSTAQNAATLRQAAGCTATLPPFGGIAAGYSAPNGTIAMRNDGGWCWLSIGWTWRGEPAMPSGRLQNWPRHGKVVTGPVDGVLRVAYRPAPGFAGEDFFRLRLVAPGQVNMIPVHVTVTK